MIHLLRPKSAILHTSWELTSTLRAARSLGRNYFTYHEGGGGDIPVHVVHLGQVLHAIGNTSHHTHRLHHLKLPIIGSEKGVQGAILHVLRDDHNRGGLGDHALQEDDVRVLELSLDRSLCQEI